MYGFVCTRNHFRLQISVHLEVCAITHVVPKVLFIINCEIILINDSAVPPFLKIFSHTNRFMEELCVVLQDFS